MSRPNPFRDFKTSPEIIHPSVKMYLRFPLALRNVENLLHERVIDVNHKTVRSWQSASAPIQLDNIRSRLLPPVICSRETALSGIEHAAEDLGLEPGFPGHPIIFMTERT